MSDAAFEIIDPDCGSFFIQGFVPDCGYGKGASSIFLALPLNVNGQWCLILGNAAEREMHYYDSSKVNQGAGRVSVYMHCSLWIIPFAVLYGF